ncbi:hypothetical protein OAL01_00500 [Rubripirellula sp.]|nr:hypothetical protein [Rubripirellula sp.]
MSLILLSVRESLNRERALRVMGVACHQGNMMEQRSDLNVWSVCCLFGGQRLCI